MEIEHIKSVWLGPEFISIGDVRVKGNEMMFRRVGGVPGVTGFTPVLANAMEVPYQERTLWHPGSGDTGIKVRVFLSDLRLNKYYALINPQDLNVIMSLKKKIESYEMYIEQLHSLLFDSSGEDRMQKKIKRHMDIYNQIKGYGGGGYGGYGGYGGVGGMGNDDIGLGGQPPI